MIKKTLCLTGALAVALALAAASASAGSWHLHKSARNSADLSIASTMELANGTQLKPGDYNLELSDDTSSPQALFYKDGDLIARSPVKLESSPQKIDQTEILSNQQGSDNVINEIDPSGWTERLVFTDSSSNTAKAGQ